MRLIMWVPFLSCLLALHCSRDYPLFEKPDGRFPLIVGNEWRLSREWKIEFYRGTPPGFENPRVERYSIRWEITAIDIVSEYKSWVLVNYEKRDPISRILSVDWYTNSWEGSEGLYHIAYDIWGDGLPPKLPQGYKLVFTGKEFSSFEEIFAWACGQPCTDDAPGEMPKGRTIRVPPRRVLEYPLAMGKQWVAFNDVWLQTRRVIDKEPVTTKAGTFSCFRIEVVGEIWKEYMVWYDWFSDEGLVKRYIWSTGEWTDAYGTPVGKWESTDVWLLESYSVR